MTNIIHLRDFLVLYKDAIMLGILFYNLFADPHPLTKY